MRLLACIASASLVALAAPALAQDAAPVPPPVTRPVATVSVGLGNAHGWNGLQAEWHGWAGRGAVFVGGGFSPRTSYDKRRFTAAAGVRVFSRGRRHRLFGEASVSQIGREVASYLRPQGRQVYGPGLQLGYELRLHSGVTAMLSGGAGYGLGVSGYNNPWRPMAGVALGYTWSAR